jgi:hypothetical protein
MPRKLVVMPPLSARHTCGSPAFCRRPAVMSIRPTICTLCAVAAEAAARPAAATAARIVEERIIRNTPSVLVGRPILGQDPRAARWKPGILDVSRNGGVSSKPQ